MASKRQSGLKEIKPGIRHVSLIQKKKRNESKLPLSDEDTRVKEVPCVQRSGMIIVPTGIGYG